MVTYPSSLRRLYIEEWRQFRGLSVIRLAEIVGVTRQTIDRYQEQQHRLTPAKIASLARALDLEPEDLYRPPGRKSVDAIIGSLSDEDHEIVVELAHRLARRASA